MRKSDTRATLALGVPLTPADPPTVIVGVPDAAWSALGNGETMTFDLRYAGIFAQLVVFRGKDGAEVARLLGESQTLLDSAKFVGIEAPKLN